MLVDKWPIVAVLEVTARCNARCLICERSSPKAELASYNTDIPDAVLEKALPFIENAEFCDVTGYGEFLLSPQAEKIMRICAAANTGMMMTTNGTLLSRYIELIESTIGKFNQIILSIQSHIPELYTELSGGLKIADLEAGIEVAKTHCEKLIFSHVIHKKNIDHLRDFVLWCHEKGAKNLMFRDMLRLRPSHDEVSMLDEPEKHDRIILECKQLAWDLGMWLEEWPVAHLEFNNTPPVPKWECAFPYRQLHFNGDGTNQVCCQMTAIKGTNVLDKTEAWGIWNSPEIQQIRVDLKNHKVPAACRMCCDPRHCDSLEQKAKYSEDL